jgi:hypothetical protein
MREMRTGCACQYNGFSLMLHHQSQSVHSPAFHKNSATVLFKYMDKVKSRGSAVGTATGHGLNDQGVGVRVPVG